MLHWSADGEICSWHDSHARCCVIGTVHDLTEAKRLTWGAGFGISMFYNAIHPPSFYLRNSTNNSTRSISLVFFILLSTLLEFKNGNSCIFILLNYGVLTSGVKRNWKTSDVCFSFHFIRLYTPTHLRYSGRKRKLSFGSVLCFLKKTDCSKDNTITASARLTFLEHREEWVHVNVCSVGLCAVCTLHTCTYCGTPCHCSAVTDRWYRSVVQ